MCSSDLDAKSRIGGLPLSSSPGEFVQVITDWLNDTTSGVVAEAKELAPDELPDEGVPVSEEYIEDDEPAFVGETN